MSGAPTKLARWLEGVEAAIERSEKHAAKCRGGGLEEAEWRELYYALNNAADIALLKHLDVKIRCEPEEEAGAVRTPRASVERALQLRLDESRVRLKSLISPWFCLGRHAEVSVPGSPGQRIGFQAFVAPGDKLRPFCAEGFPPDGSTTEDSTLRYRRVPDLEITGLADSGGKILFCGLLHSFLPLHELSGERLAQLAEDERWSLMSERVSREGDPKVFCRLLEQQTRDRLRTVTRSSAAAATVASDLKRATGKQLVRELVTAILVVEPHRLNRYSESPWKPLTMVSIALPGAGDAESFAGQYECFGHYGAERRRTVAVELRESVGKLCRVNVPVEIRQFAFPSADAGSDLIAGIQHQNDEALEWLLGSVGESRLGGKMAVWHVVVKHQLANVDSECAEAELEAIRLEQNSYEADRERVSEARDLLTKLRERRGFIAAARDATKESAKRLKALWATQATWPADDAARVEAATLTARLFRLMGDSPIISARSGSGLAAELDAEIKACAALARAGGGRLPSIDSNAAEWQAARSAFTPNC